MFTPPCNRMPSSTTFAYLTILVPFIARAHNHFRLLSYYHSSLQPSFAVQWSHIAVSPNGVLVSGRVVEEVTRVYKPLPTRRQLPCDTLICW